ncbi:MAG: T9SS type A sorting domain-containing protein [Saprospiraceae bacterium]|nr:T9SS type A sorting domain-containing protein [Saprospiraceae bacterium]
MATITDGMLNAGHHKIVVASHLDPGLYWYRVQVGGQMATGKMVKIW